MIQQDRASSSHFKRPPSPFPHSVHGLYHRVAGRPPEERDPEAAGIRRHLGLELGQAFREEVSEKPVRI